MSSRSEDYAGALEMEVDRLRAALAVIASPNRATYERPGDAVEIARAALQGSGSAAPDPTEPNTSLPPKGWEPLPDTPCGQPGSCHHFYCGYELGKHHGRPSAFFDVLMLLRHGAANGSPEWDDAAQAIEAEFRGEMGGGPVVGTGPDYRLEAAARRAYAYLVVPEGGRLDDRQAIAEELWRALNVTSGGPNV